MTAAMIALLLVSCALLLTIVGDSIYEWIDRRRARRIAQEVVFDLEGEGSCTECGVQAMWYRNGLCENCCRDFSLAVCQCCGASSCATTPTRNGWGECHVCHGLWRHPAMGAGK